MAFEPFKLDTLVELLDQYSNVYPSSPTGARGWIRARRELPKIDPEVYIEWDKTHWRYHGEQDGWTFEHHFRPVDDNMPDPISSGDDLNIMDRILQDARAQVDSERCPNCGELHHPEDDFLSALAEGQEEALRADGFFLMTLKPSQEGDFVLYEPQIYSASLTPMAQEMLRAQLLHVAAQIYEDDVQVRIRDLEGPDGPQR